ncbi:hypothetical protein NKR19_g10331 [Coniochaeta hoffmannii]|uniref:Uncharacterized protein n=1 Tax=Coniochaeta hoffmannii TaxID=91930 RepID=A0AA38VFA6_9PEZI|nr:hypothetical protein NKR19_g10331 [Coniochaeta hoffmannii]
MEATPVIDGLLKSAVDAVRYLDQKSVEVTTSQTQLEGGRGNLRKLALPGLRVDDASAETQKIINHTTRLKTRINERLDDAKKTQAALQGLCIQDLQRLTGQQFLVDAKALLGSLPLRGLASSIAGRFSGHGGIKLVLPGTSTVRLSRLRFRRRPLGDSSRAR